MDAYRRHKIDTRRINIFVALVKFRIRLTRTRTIFFFFLFSLPNHQESPSRNVSLEEKDRFLLFFPLTPFPPLSPLLIESKKPKSRSSTASELIARPFVPSRPSFLPLCFTVSLTGHPFTVLLPLCALPPLLRSELFILLPLSVSLSLVTLGPPPTLPHLYCFFAPCRLVILDGRERNGGSFVPPTRRNATSALSRLTRPRSVISQRVIRQQQQQRAYLYYPYPL